ncbi:MAG: peptide-methionine (S)-S-oxide reductase MsrA [Alistipes sp.]|nr:peptide-methionine (S)-S-oxide reductase MsrA [Alistipes sp.]
MKEIYLAGGCFWGTEHYLKQIRGVVATEVGYANGRGENPTYEEVYTDTTGFVECVKVEYDPELLPLERVVELYFHSIDPQSLNKQGNDIGTRYRTGIYYTDPSDRVTIEEVYRAVESKVGGEIVVELEPLRNFYTAEEYHQDYLDKNPAGYCHLPYYLFEYARKANE